MVQDTVVLNNYGIIINNYNIYTNMKGENNRYEYSGAIFSMCNSLLYNSHQHIYYKGQYSSVS